MKIIANDYEEKDIMKMLRENTNLNQKEFGESIGLSRIAIQTYERGVRNFSFKTLMKICKKHGFVVTVEKKK